MHCLRCGAVIFDPLTLCSACHEHIHGACRACRWHYHRPPWFRGEGVRIGCLIAGSGLGARDRVEAVNEYRQQRQSAGQPIEVAACPSGEVAAPELPTCATCGARVGIDRCRCLEGA